jgi:phage terminase large subunit GpA-like protein
MVAREFLESKDYPERLMNWRNSWMAEPWVEKFETRTEVEMLDSVIELAPSIVPAGTVGLTAGIDPSEGGFWFVVLAWKKDMSPHLVRYGYLASWIEVKDLIWEGSYQIEGTENRLPIWRAGVDTGGTAKEGHDLTMTEQSYDFLRKYGRGRVFGCKGMSHPSMHKIQISKIDKMPQGSPIPGGITLLNLDTGAFKDAIHYRLQIKEGDPGRFSFHRETDADFINHLLSEEKRVDFRTGRSDWVQVKKAGHWLDACVYAYAVADPELYGGVRVLLPRPPKKEGEAQTRPDPFRQGREYGWPSGGKQKSWVSNW